MTASLSRILDGRATELDRLWLNPEEVFRRRGLEPDLWQIDCARQIWTTDSILLLCSRQAGKALDVDTPIATVDGWRTMGGIKVGDQVFDEMGRPARVIDKSHVSCRAAFRVKFSDGSEIIADGEHLWTAMDLPTRRAMERESGVLRDCWPSWRSIGKHGHHLETSIVTTSVIAQNLTHNRESVWAIPATKPLDLPDADLPIKPYTLGVWLGDGSSTDARVSKPDDELFRLIEQDGYNVGIDISTNERSQSRTIGGNLRRAETLHRLLSDNNLLRNKHIPERYLRASISQRVALLQGLMDTDGTASSRVTSRCEFCTTTKAIAEGFIELTVGLGLVVSVHKGIAKLYGREIGPKWRIFFTPWFQPFRLKRKMERVDHVGGKQFMRRLRYIRSIEPVGLRNVCCIKVDSPNRLFLAGKSMIPTHNSETDSALALLTVMLTPPALVLFLAPTHRQSKELLKYKFQPMYEPWREFCPMMPGKDNEESKEFLNGSRIVILPDREQNVRSYSSVSLLVMDEASRISDGLYKSVRPMLAVSRGRMIASTTAFGQRGWFYNEWEDQRMNWKRVNAKGKDCKRLSAAFLESERLRMGDRWYKQEYENSFESAIGAVFDPEMVKAAFGRVSEEEAWNDLFGVVPMPEPRIVEAETLEIP